MDNKFFSRKLFLFVLTWVMMSVTVQAGDLYVYRNIKNSEELKLPEVRQMLEARKLVWDNGKAIVLVLPDFRNISDSDFESFVSMTKSQFLGRWRVKFFSGRARMPVQAQDPEEALESVREGREAVYFTFDRVSTPGDLNGIREEHLSF